MPRLSVWMIRASLVYLLVGFTFGGLILFHKGLSLSPVLWRLLPAHIEFLMIGWIIQLVAGVAFWILPRFSRAPRRGNVRLAWIAFGLFNFGLWMSSFGPLLSTAAWLPFLAKVLQAGAATALVLHAWPRIKPSGA